MTLFERVKKDVKDALYEELKICVSANESDDTNTFIINDNCEVVVDIAKRIEYIDESTVKYLIGLTNTYSSAIIDDDKRRINAIADIFKKYGFDIHSLDEKIRNMFPKIGTCYDISGIPCASKRQEEILKIVFEHFGCPGELPTIENIYEKASIFGIEYESYGSLPRINTSLLVDPYNAGNYHYKALSNGLSSDQIIEYTKQIDMMLSYYQDHISCSLLEEKPIEISSVIWELDCEIEQRYQKVAADFYKVQCRLLYANNNLLQLQLDQLTNVNISSYGRQLV